MILVVGLSPAWQRTLVFERVVAGKVNRAQRVTETASGKGVNVARVIGQLGGEARLLTVAGGERGKLLVESLRAKQIPATVVPVAAETRICQTLIDGRDREVVPTGEVTELVEEAGKLTRTEVAAVMKVCRRELQKARMVVLSGSLPIGCGDDFFARLTRLAKGVGVPVLVDVQGTQLLNAVAERPFLVKINRDELQATRRTAAGLRRLGAEWVIITDGSREVTAYGAGRKFVVEPPRITAVNAIGSGDAMLAGLAMGIERGLPVDGAGCLLGVVTGAANALTAEPGCVDMADVRRWIPWGPGGPWF